MTTHIAGAVLLAAVVSVYAGAARADGWPTGLGDTPGGASGTCQSPPRVLPSPSVPWVDVASALTRMAPGDPVLCVDDVCATRRDFDVFLEDLPASRHHTDGFLIWGAGAIVAHTLGYDPLCHHWKCSPIAAAHMRATLLKRPKPFADWLAKELQRQTHPADRKLRCLEVDEGLVDWAPPEHACSPLALYAGLVDEGSLTSRVHRLQGCLAPGASLRRRLLCNTVDRERKPTALSQLSPCVARFARVGASLESAAWDILERKVTHVAVDSAHPAGVMFDNRPRATAALDGAATTCSADLDRSMWEHSLSIAEDVQVESIFAKAFLTHCGGDAICRQELHAWVNAHRDRSEGQVLFRLVHRESIAAASMAKENLERAIVDDEFDRDFYSVRGDMAQALRGRLSSPVPLIQAALPRPGDASTIHGGCGGRLGAD